MRSMVLIALNNVCGGALYHLAHPTQPRYCTVHLDLCYPFLPYWLTLSYILTTQQYTQVQLLMLLHPYLAAISSS